jgi:hypothetical protein
MEIHNKNKIDYIINIYFKISKHLKKVFNDFKDWT